jgi:hypothetical protein
MDPGLTPLLPYLLPLLALVLIVRRSLRRRRLKAERLWVMPVLLLAIAGSSLAASPPAASSAVAAVVAAAALGALAGWWRGRLTHIAVDPATHELTSRTSVVGALLVAGLFAVRYGLRMIELQRPAALPGGAGLATDALMAFAVAMVAVQRLEMWLRSRRLVAEAVRAKAG